MAAHLGRDAEDPFSLDEERDADEADMGVEDDALERLDAAAQFGFDPGRLSADARWALARIAKPLAAGAGMGQIAAATGRSRRVLAKALDGLRDELHALPAP